MTNTMLLRSRVPGNWQARFWRAAALVRESLTLITSLEIEHIQPRCKGGSNSATNLTLACHKCNQNKGEKDVKVFLKGKPEVLKKILATASKSLADTAAVNATRLELKHQLITTGLPVEVGTGGLTKFNRTQQGLEKTHWLDAACVGASTPVKLKNLPSKPLLIKAMGHGTRQMCGTDKFGFVVRHRSRVQVHQGFKTGDIVKAAVTSGKKVGTYVGRVLCRASGSFDIATSSGRVTGISHKFCTQVHRKDGYNYAH